VQVVFHSKGINMSWNWVYCGS